MPPASDDVGAPSDVRGHDPLASDAEATPSEIRERVARGLPFSAFESVRERFQIPIAEATAVLHMPVRTLARRRAAGRLAADESDRLSRLARVAGHAARVLGSDAKAAAWLRRPNRALNGDPPLRWLDSDAGATHVDDMLGRLAHGGIG